jgi:prepilin signal peptidase PulO-like enzyme (type II secretory pathway)
MPYLTGLDLPLSFYAASAFVLGLIFGSFLNVVIYRVPRGESVVYPGSHCAACGAPVKAFDNIPLLSFALLGGRCRSCRARISFSYPMVELCAGLMFVAIVFKTGPSWEALLDFAFTCVMISLVFIDARHQLLPNVITYPAFLFALIGGAARGASGERLSTAFDISILFPGLQTEFAPWRAALFGGALFAIAAPAFWLLDKLDPILFGKYFDWEEIDDNPRERSPGGAAQDASAAHGKDRLADASRQGGRRLQEFSDAERRHNRAIRATMIVGVITAVAWALAVVSLSSKYQPGFEDAYGGLMRASVGALISGGLIWCIRALYFFIRGFEGMGLGDIKMMSIVGAFLGLGGAIGALLLGSISGVIAGLILIYRGGRDFKAPLPFGACLGGASLIVMIVMTLSPFNFAKP